MLTIEVPTTTNAIDLQTYSRKADKEMGEFRATVSAQRRFRQSQRKDATSVKETRRDTWIKLALGIEVCTYLLSLRSQIVGVRRSRGSLIDQVLDKRGSCPPGGEGVEDTFVIEGYAVHDRRHKPLNVKIVRLPVHLFGT